MILSVMTYGQVITDMTNKLVYTLLAGLPYYHIVPATKYIFLYNYKDAPIHY
jgi:hypothetical protein